jgi:hypothetical protein
MTFARPDVCDHGFLGVALLALDARVGWPGFLFMALSRYDGAGRSQRREQSGQAYQSFPGRLPQRKARSDRQCGHIIVAVRRAFRRMLGTAPSGSAETYRRTACRITSAVSEIVPAMISCSNSITSPSYNRSTGYPSTVRNSHRQVPSLQMTWTDPSGGMVSIGFGQRRSFALALISRSPVSTIRCASSPRRSIAAVVLCFIGPLARTRDAAWRVADEVGYSGLHTVELTAHCRVADRSLGKNQLGFNERLRYAAGADRGDRLRTGRPGTNPAVVLRYVVDRADATPTGTEPINSGRVAGQLRSLGH